MATKDNIGRFKGTPEHIRTGLGRKEIYINIKEFIDMVKFIKDHPVDRQFRNRKDDDVPISATGKYYWHEAMKQILECMVYIDKFTPMTSARRVIHEQKLDHYREEDSRVDIYEYVRTRIMETNGGSSNIQYDNKGKK